MRDGETEAEKRHTVSVKFLFSSFSLLFFFSVSQPVGGGWHAWMREWVGRPVVLTAPDRAVLMGADDD